MISNIEPVSLLKDMPVFIYYHRNSVRKYCDESCLFVG